MAFYSYFFTANYKGFFRSLSQVAKKEKRFFPWLLMDAGFCVFRYGMGMQDYLNYKIYLRNAKERQEYVSIRVSNEFYEEVSPSKYKKRYTVKPNFLREFRDYTKREFLVPEEGNFAQFDDFLNRNAGFMAKPYDGLAGQDVRKLVTADITDREAFFRECIENRVFVEELVIQHPEMNVLCAGSVNTIRIMTFNNHGKPEILWLGMRVGNGINAVDNFHAQGMGVSIDLQTGRFVGNALDKDGVEFEYHPTSGVKFDGFQIPYFQEAVDMVLRACLESDKILVVGWDVAISENGPLLIEGNRRPGFDLVQMLDGRGRKDMLRHVLKCVREEK